MRIENGKLVIRNAGKEDCAQLAEWWNDGSVMAHAGFPDGLHTSAEEIEQSLAGDGDDTRRRLIIDCDGLSIGETSYRVKDEKTVEIGIKICDPDYQEKGLGRVLLSMLIRRLFDLGYEKIVLDTNLKNIRAQHVYEKLGFRKVRVNIDSWTDQRGQLQSSVDYELTERDFHDFTR